MKAGRIQVQNYLQRRVPKRIFFLGLLLAASAAFQVALTLAQTQPGTSCDAYGYGYGSVGCSAYSTQCDAYGVGCDAYSVNCDAYGVGCDAYSVQCDGYSVGCDAYPKADLVVTSATAPAVVNKGDQAAISWTVENIGNGLAANPYPYWCVDSNGSEIYSCWYDGVYLSTDNQLDPSVDKFVSYQANSILANGDNYTTTVTPVINNIASGSYYLIIKTDTWNYVSESNEGNNVFVGPQIMVQGEDPDLTIANPTAPATINKGEPADISWTVENQGAGVAANFGYEGPSSGYWQDQYYFSTDNQLDPHADYLLGSSYHTGVLAAGGSYQTNISPIIGNIPSGDGFLFVVVDGDNYSDGCMDCGPDGMLVETNEDNNVATLPVTIGGADPDLVPVSMDAPDTINSGLPINASWTVYNQGAGNAVPRNEWYGWGDNLYLSTDNQLDSSDMLVGNGYRNDSLPAGEGYTWAPIYSWPGYYYPTLAPGDYYLILKTDYNSYIYESDESNNTLVKPITITGPAQADLAVTALNAPDSVAAGQPINASWTVYNQGQLQVQNYFEDGLYISSDDQFDAGDQHIAYGWPLDFLQHQLTPGEGYTIGAVWGDWPDLTPGDYYLIVKTDEGNNLPESNEDNNTQVRRITITAPVKPDLTVISIDNPDSAAAGATISASWSVYNQGDGAATGGWYDGLYFSTDDQLDSGDSYIASNYRGSTVPSGTGYSITQSAGLPDVPPGTYYLIAKADIWYDYLLESNEDNNTLVRQITITPPPVPDLVPTAITGLPASATGGDQVAFSGSVQNQGGAPASSPYGYWYDQVYLSTDDQFDDTDRPVGHQWYVGALAGGAGYTLDFAGRIPNVESGTYYVLLVADEWNAVYEANENNNVLVAGQLEIEKSSDTTPPVISNLSVIPTCNGATISWTTDELADTFVGWWDPWAYYENPALATSHSYTISGLNPGSTYNYGIITYDAVYNQTSIDPPLTFTTLGNVKPSLSLSRGSVFWASYADYTARHLSISYAIRNAGAIAANNVLITGSQATQGVSLTTPMSLYVGDLTPGSTTSQTLVYFIPVGVTSFTAKTTASATDACGSTYTYP